MHYLNAHFFEYTKAQNVIVGWVAKHFGNCYCICIPLHRAQHSKVPGPPLEGSSLVGAGGGWQSLVAPANGRHHLCFLAVGEKVR